MKDSYRSIWENFSYEVISCEWAGLKIENLEEIRSYLYQAIEDDLIPGAVLLIAYHGNIVMNEAFGYSQIIPFKKKMVNDNIFDIASLTKVVSVWPAILKLIEDNKINLQDTLDKYFDFEEGSYSRNINIEHLLTHTSGLPDRTYLKQYGSSKEDIINGICNESLMDDIGSRVIYSNRGFILLGEIVERVTQQSLDHYLKKNIWQPLGMVDTCYNPSAEFISRIAPTEYFEDVAKCKIGIVHDENCEWLGGIAGHAGVFSTTKDLASFCAMIMAKGRSHGNQIIKEELIRQSLKNHTQHLNEDRGYAWKKYEECPYSENIYGHLGFTGTSIWLDLSSNMFAILLTNRVHPDRNKYLSIQQVRKDIRKKCCKLAYDIY